jgi:hypothetical protein
VKVTDRSVSIPILIGSPGAAVVVVSLPAVVLVSPDVVAVSPDVVVVPASPPQAATTMARTVTNASDVNFERFLMVLLRFLISSFGVVVSLGVR